MTSKIIYEDDEGTAEPCTLSGWKSIHGRFFTTEAAAKYDSMTHRKCPQCGAAMVKPYTLCEGCRDLKALAKYNALPAKEWDGVQMLYSEANDEYYSSPEAAEEYLEDEGDGVTLADLRLVLCRPNYVRELDPEYVSDDLPEGGDIPHGVEEAMEAFNAVVKGIVLSWEPGTHRLLLEDQPPEKEL